MQKFPDYEPHLRAWRARARPTFVRTSAVVALVIIPIARYVLDLGFQVRVRKCTATCGGRRLALKSTMLTAERTWLSTHLLSLLAGSWSPSAACLFAS